MASGSTPPTRNKRNFTPGMPRSGTTHRSMTDCTGVNVIGNITGQNVTLTANVTQQAWKKEKAQRIHKRTLEKIQTWTKGTVQTSALKKILEKLNNGESWVTVAGTPGEGKTTCVYMALEELQKRGREVFQVFTPDEYLEVTDNCTKCVIMLDDILGDLEFDPVEWLCWKAVLHHILDGKEDQPHNEAKETEDKEITVILVGRHYIINAASRYLGKVSDFFTSDKYVVDLSQKVHRGDGEKKNILNAIVLSSGIQLSKYVVEDICSLNISHGFPHVCRLFVTAYREDEKIDAVSFFRAPLKFLNQTIARFVCNDQKVRLFKEIILGGGVVTIQKLSQMEGGLGMIRTANDMIGTYLRKEDVNYVFDHPSIYDCVAYNLCKLDPLFGIEKCGFSFVFERLQLPQFRQESSDGESKFIVDIPISYMRHLAKRFAKELENGEFTHLFSHRACLDRTFVVLMMTHVAIPMSRLLNLTDCTHETLLEVLPINDSKELFRYFDSATDIRQHHTPMYTLLCGVFRHHALDILTYLIETGYAVDVNLPDPSSYMNLALLTLHSLKNTKFVDLMLTLNPDLTARDNHQRTLLHMMCLRDYLPGVKRLLDMGADVNAIDDWNRWTPLQNAQSPEIESLLKRHGAVTAAELR